MRVANLIVWAQSRSFPCTVLELLHACFDLTASEYVSEASSRARDAGLGSPLFARSLARCGGAELGTHPDHQFAPSAGESRSLRSGRPRTRVDGKGSSRAFADGRWRGSAFCINSMVDRLLKSELKLDCNIYRYAPQKRATCSHLSCPRLNSRVHTLRTSLHTHTEVRKSLCTWLRDCSRQDEADVISNSRNKFHQTTYKDFFSALYMCSIF